MAVDINKMIETIGTDDYSAILDIFGIDLADMCPAATLSAACEWHETVEDRWWPMAAYELPLSDLYAVRWTVTDEAGVDDVEIVEIVSDDPEEEAVDLRDWLISVAGNISGDGETRNAEAVYSA